MAEQSDDALLREALQLDQAGRLPPDQSRIVREAATRRGLLSQAAAPAALEQMPAAASGTFLPGPAGAYMEQQIGQGYQAANQFVAEHTPQLMSHEQYMNLPLPLRLGINYGPQVAAAFATGGASLPAQVGANLATVGARQLLGAEKPGLAPYGEAAASDVLVRGGLEFARGATGALVGASRGGQRYTAEHTALDETQALAARVQTPGIYQAATEYVGDTRRRVMALLRRRVQDIPLDAARAAQQWVRDLPTPTEADIARLYDRVDTFDVQVPLGALTQVKAALRGHEEIIGDVAPGVTSGRIRQMAAESPIEATARASGEEATASFQAVRAVLSRLGQRIGDLRAAVNSGNAAEGTAEQLRAASQMYSTIQNTLENLADSNMLGAEARIALREANAANRVYRTVEDLGGLVESLITTPQGLQSLNPGKLADALRKPQNAGLVRNLDELGILPQFTRFLDGWTQQQTTGRAAVRGAQDVQMMLEANLRGIGGPGNPLHAAGVAGGITGAGVAVGQPVAGAALGGTYLLGQQIASYLLTPRGQRTVQAFMDGTHGAFSPRTAQLLTGLTRSGLIAVQDDLRKEGGP